MNWLRVLGGTELPQIDPRVDHEFHAVMPTLLVLKPQQQLLQFVLPRQRPLSTPSVWPPASRLLTLLEAARYPLR
jgi:hypothetical protein